MRKFKLVSILSVILIAMLSVCTMTHAQVYNDTKEVNEILKKIGIITESEYNPNAEITRIDYLKWVLRAVKCDENSYAGTAKQVFYDVADTDEIAPVVNLGYDLGIIKGYADGRFCPNESIKINEAAIMAMRAAGAGEFINTSGSWIQAAISLDLLDKISVEEGSAITGATAERVIFNMLNAGLIQSDNGTSWYIDAEKSVLEMKHGVERATGIVDSNSYGNLYGGNGTLENHVSIDGNLFELDAEFDGLFLGENVVYYYEKDRYSGDVIRVIYMCSGRNEIIDLDVESVNSLNSLRMDYFDENDKNEYASISPTAVTLENGVKSTIPSSGYELPKYGRVKLIDNNNDSEFDVVLVTSVEMRVINTFLNDVVYFSSTPASNIKFENYEKVVIKNKNGEILGTDALTAGSLVEIVAASDMSHIEIVVLNDTATLTIKGMEERDSNGYSVWYITDDAGNEYRTARDFESICPDNKLVIGASHNVLLNSNGHIAALAGDPVGDIAQYGYVVKVYEKEPIGEGDIFLRIFTSASQMIDYPTKEKVVNVTTNKTVKNTQLLTLCASPQVVRYTLNGEGEVSKIEFASTDSSSEGFKEGMTAPAKGDSSVGTYYARYYSANSLIGPSIPVGADTIVFSVPLESDSDYDTYKDDYTKYSAFKKAGLVNQRYYYGLKSYMYGDDFYAKVLVTSSVSNNSVDKSDPRMVVSSVSTVYNEAEDATKLTIVGYVDGSESTYVLDDESLLKWTPSGETEERTISDGDVIRLNVDQNGKITAIVVAFDYSEKEVFSAPDSSYTEAKDYNTSAVHIYGTVSAKYENAFFSVLRDGYTASDSSSSYIYPITKAVTYIYEYDGEQKRGQRIRNITLAEVMTLEDDPELEDKIVMVTQDTRVPLMVIYK